MTTRRKSLVLVPGVALGHVCPGVNAARHLAAKPRDKAADVCPQQIRKERNLQASMRLMPPRSRLTFACQRRLRPDEAGVEFVGEIDEQTATRPHFSSRSTGRNHSASS